VTKNRDGLGKWANKAGETVSRSTSVITYSQALASASREDVSTCGSPRGHS